MHPRIKRLMRIDFDLLNDELMAPENEKVRLGFRQALDSSHFCSALVKRRTENWRSLQIDSPYKDLLHPKTVARLEADQYSKAPLQLKFEFERLREMNPCLKQLLLALRPCTTPYKDTWRTTPVTAEAGFTKLIAHFPDPILIAPTLDLLEELRRSAPTHDPVWNVLILELLLLRLHPFRDGNGRTARAVAAYELWRLGISKPMIIPSRRALDANRATQLYFLTALSECDEMGTRMLVLSRYLCFRAEVWIKAQCDY